jgi:hypothetical protein
MKRGRKEAIAIWDCTLESFFREVLNLYYPIISAISKASNLSARLGDLQRFLDDMIQVVLSSNRQPSQFIALCERHEQVSNMKQFHHSFCLRLCQSLYHIVHECHTNGNGLTQSLIEWLRRG